MNPIRLYCMLFFFLFVTSGFPSEQEKLSELNKSLFHAATDGTNDQVKTLLTQGANVNAKDERGQNVLHLAIRKGKSDLVELLISKGADVNATDMFGWATLHFTATQDTEEIKRQNLI
jgi:ankyrin repeat protein